jgi:ABC-type transport system involved in multi-copper enzyme maturation permease subunit
MIVLTVARLTLVEAGRRKVVWALAALTAILLVLNGWGFAELPGLHTRAGQLTSGTANLIAAQLLNLVMFTVSLIVALGTAFLAGPTLSGELESGVGLAVFARPVRRASILVGKWLGLVIFAAGYVALAGTVEFGIVSTTVGYTPDQPVTALALLVAEAVVLLTLALLLSSLLSPLASGVVAVGLFGATWVAGVVGGVGAAIGNDGVARVGTVSRMLLPTDGLWHGVMHALQVPTVAAQFGEGAIADPFLALSAPTVTYLAWALAWTALVLGVGVVSFARRDL